MGSTNTAVEAISQAEYRNQSKNSSDTFIYPCFCIEGWQVGKEKSRLILALVQSFFFLFFSEHVKVTVLLKMGKPPVLFRSFYEVVHPVQMIPCRCWVHLKMPSTKRSIAMSAGPAAGACTAAPRGGGVSWAPSLKRVTREKHRKAIWYMYLLIKSEWSPFKLNIVSIFPT